MFSVFTAALAALSGVEGVPAVRRSHAAVEGAPAKKGGAAAGGGGKSHFRVEMPFYEISKKRTGQRFDAGVGAVKDGEEVMRQGSCLKAFSVDQEVASFSAKVGLVNTGKKFPQENPSDQKPKFFDADVTVAAHSCGAKDMFAMDDEDIACRPIKLDNLNERGHFYTPPAGKGATVLLFKVNFKDGKNKPALLTGSDTSYTFSMLVGDGDKFMPPGYGVDMGIVTPEIGTVAAAFHVYQPNKVPSNEKGEYLLSQGLVVVPYLTGDNSVTKWVKDKHRAVKQLIATALYYHRIAWRSGTAFGEADRKTYNEDCDLMDSCLISLMTGKKIKVDDACAWAVDNKAKLKGLRAFSCPAGAYFDTTPADTFLSEVYKLEDKQIFPRPGWEATAKRKEQPTSSGLDKRNMKSTTGETKWSLDIFCATAVAEKGKLAEEWEALLAKKEAAADDEYYYE